jgi:hypothetical protein
MILEFDNDEDRTKVVKFGAKQIWLGARKT